MNIKAPTGASAAAAAVAAGHGVLTRLYPAQKASLDAALTASLAKIPDSPAKVGGINVGKEVAEKLVAIRSTDRADRKGEYKAQKAVGIWQPTPPLFVPALLPNWSEVTPFVIKRADQFKIPAPLPLNSDAYAKELNEVKLLGGRYSTARTAEQTATAIFSAISPVPLWNTPARAAATAKGNNLIENARLFHCSTSQAQMPTLPETRLIKYKYKLWRPVVAIPNAAELGNPVITPDPNWESLIVTPAHPDYISGHCVTAGAAERVLQRFFGSDSVKVSLIFPANAGVTRSYTSFSQISKELGESRIWAGVHTRTADTHGDVLGKQVGNDVSQ